MKAQDNIWLGNNELLIRFRNGTHVVLEGYEDYEVVFTGTYEECFKYMTDRWIEYEESIIG